MCACLIASRLLGNGVRIPLIRSLPQRLDKLEVFTVTLPYNRVDPLPIAWDLVYRNVTLSIYSAGTLFTSIFSLLLRYHSLVSDQVFHNAYYILYQFYSVKVNSRCLTAVGTYL